MSYQPGGDVVAIDHEALGSLANTVVTQHRAKGHWLGAGRCPRCVARADTGQGGLLALLTRELYRRTHPDTRPHADV